MTGCDRFFCCVFRWLKVFGIPADGSRTWLAYHHVASLHVWMVFKRLKTEELQLAEAGKDDEVSGLKFLGQELYDRFWEDTSERVRDTKVRAKAPATMVSFVCCVFGS